MTVYKFGVIGCGNVSQRHINAIRSLHNSELVAVSDSDIIKLNKVAKENNVKAYADYTELLNDSDIDAVSICTPNSTHTIIGIAAAKAGKHILTEKPIGINLEEVEELIRTCKENNVKLSVVKQVRLNPAVQILKKSINEKKLGKILSANVTVRWNRNEDYYESSPW